MIKVGDANEVKFLRQIKIDPEQRAIYKEIARRIVSSDRVANKRGVSQNTIGEIQRALVSAYVAGCMQGQNPVQQPTSKALTWLQIPSRSRDTISSLTYCYSARFSRPEYTPALIMRFNREGKWRWSHIDNNGDLEEHSVADGSVQPLVRLELLAPINTIQDVYELTEEGVRICKDYWERSDRDDPTLPKASLR